MHCAAFEYICKLLKTAICSKYKRKSEYCVPIDGEIHLKWYCTTLH